MLVKKQRNCGLGIVWCVIRTAIHSENILAFQCIGGWIDILERERERESHCHFATFKVPCHCASWSMNSRQITTTRNMACSAALGQIMGIHTKGLGQDPTKVLLPVENPKVHCF